MQKIALLALIGLAGSASAAVWSGTGFVIPDASTAGISSVIAVSGDAPSIGGVEVTLFDLRHTWVGDLVATLTSPSGTEFTLFARVGAAVPGAGDSSNLGGNYIFSDSAAGDFWAEAAAGTSSYVMASGAYRTTAALSASPTDMNAAFAGQDSTGNWTLKISDNAGADLGSLGSWELNIVVPTPGSLAVLGFAGIVAGRRRRN